MPAMISIFAHILIISLLFITFPHHTAPPVTHKTNHPVIHATAIDAAQVDQQVEAVHAQEQRLQAARRQEAARAAQKRRAEARHQRALKEAQQIRQQKQRAAQEKAEARKAQLAKQQRLREKQQDLQTKWLAQQMAAEHQALQEQQKQLQAAQMQGQVDRYRAQILQLIQSNWHPSQQNEHLYCIMLAHIAPGGLVTSVDIVRSSQDVALDNSAKTAIYKSSPLPVPKDATLFNAFRQLRIKMSPKEVN